MGLGEQAALTFVPAAYEPGQNHRIHRLPGSFTSGGPVNGCQQFDTIRGSESRHEVRDRADPAGGSVVRVLPDPVPGLARSARHERNGAELQYLPCTVTVPAQVVPFQRFQCVIEIVRIRTVTRFRIVEAKRLPALLKEIHELLDFLQARHLPPPRAPRTG